MKVHEKTNEQICYELVTEIMDKVESTTERKHGNGEHDAANCTTRKRKLDEDDVQDDQSIIKIKLEEDETDEEALRKILKEQTAEYDRKVALSEKCIKYLVKEMLSKEHYRKICKKH